MADMEISRGKLNCFNKRQWKALVLAFELYASKQIVLESESQTDKVKLSDLINVPFVEYVHDKVFRAFHSQVTALAAFSCKPGNSVKEMHLDFNSDHQMPETTNNIENVANSTSLTNLPVPSIPKQQEERQSTSKCINVLLEYLFSNKYTECDSTGGNVNSQQYAELDLRPLTLNEINLLSLCYRTQIKMQAYYNKLVSNNTNAHNANSHCYDKNHSNTNAVVFDLYEDDKSELEKFNRKGQEFSKHQRTKIKNRKTTKVSKQEVKHGYTSKVNNQLVENRKSRYDYSKRSVTDVDDTDENMMQSPEKKTQENHNKSKEIDRYKSDNREYSMFQSDVSQAQLICQVCYESGGDLYLCSQCKRWMHEICGGPHPPETNSLLSHSRKIKNLANGNIENEVMNSSSNNNYNNSLTNLCKQCRVEMRVTSSSSSSSEEEEEECESSSSLTEKKLRIKRNTKSEKKKRRRSDSQSSCSLRSSTSSSERAELDAFFGSDDDSDTSLSGFIVRSSEDEDNEEQEEYEKKRINGVHSKTNNRIKRVRDLTSPVPSSESSIAPLSTQSSLSIADDILENNNVV